MLALLLATFPFSAAAQTKTTAPTPPPAHGGAVVGTNPQAPPGAKPAVIQDARILPPAPKDPWQLERLGVAAVQKNDLVKAREFFEESWKEGELPTAPYNLACLDAREGKADAAFRELDRAIAAGFDDEETLAKDTDLASLRRRSDFARIVEGARKNRLAGDAAVVTEGLFVGPGRAPKAILLLLHEVNSDPMTVAGPFMAEAKERGLFVAAPRGPSRSGRKRFGWGAPERALEAVKRAIAEARSRAGRLPLPVIVVGAGRGGKLGLEIAARTPGLFSAVGSVGGVFDPGPSGKAGVAGLRGVPVFLGVAKGAPPELYKAMRRGRESMERLGVKRRGPSGRAPARDFRRTPRRRRRRSSTRSSRRRDRRGAGTPQRRRVARRQEAGPTASTIFRRSSSGSSVERWSPAPRRGPRARNVSSAFVTLDDGRRRGGRRGEGAQDEREAVVRHVAGRPARGWTTACACVCRTVTSTRPSGEVPPRRAEDRSVRCLDPLVEELLQLPARKLLEDGAEVAARGVASRVPPRGTSRRPAKNVSSPTTRRSMWRTQPPLS